MPAKHNINAKEIELKTKAALNILADSAAKQMESYAKNNRPWTDRTTNARNSIRGQHAWIGDKLIITVSGNVDYFQHLELGMEKRYAILNPTIVQLGPNIFKAFSQFGEMVK